MKLTNNLGYAGQVLRVDLSTGKIGAEALPAPEELRQLLGGTGLGVRILYDEVPAGVGPYDPENRLTFATGPFGGTNLGGTGTFSVVSKGPMTNGALASQANGFLGACMKFAGFDAVIVQGQSPKPVYLYIHDGQAELRDAGYLKGKDTWETIDLVAEELGQPESRLSVFSAGPAGENKVRFAAIVGDRGHVVAHGGPGAVMASKNLKAIVASRGRGQIAVKEKERLKSVFQAILVDVQKSPLDIYHWGTGLVYPIAQKSGWLPVKNYLEADFAEKDLFTSPKYRPLFKRKRTPCWACRFDHCAIVTIKEGPYAGYVGEEPEFEGFVSWGCLTGQTDPVAAVVLSNDVDRLGMDTNEAGWIMAWVIECYEKGLLTKKDTDGLEMTWGNVALMRAMLRKIAFREGFGNVLADGVMRAAQQVGGEAADLAIYTMKGNTPRGHDPRVFWQILLDVSTSNVGLDAAGANAATPASVGLPPDTDVYTPDGEAALLAASYGVPFFRDSLGICMLSIGGAPQSRILEAISAVTGWDFTADEAKRFGFRAAHMLSAFDIKHGLTPEVEAPSARFGSSSLIGPAAAQARSILPEWDKARRSSYEKMGWDGRTGRPLPETLRQHGLDAMVKDFW
ncbi:MAG: aldehyde ferredoxin oxidoreductase C-terminal domain-containing protein [Dehalococcoidia bacterium]|nr:aldehyde ferredoxin oxidoreductase C-terminal domain-containing protein [Dehalococcoidia bacterium]